MSFQFEYKDVVRKENPMVNINPLKRAKGNRKVVDLDDRVNKLNKSKEWKDTIKEWKAENKTFDLTRMPKVSMEKLGVLVIDEDIQRSLDENHCANTICDPEIFDPALLQPVICIKTSDGKFISIDAQHTVSSIAALIDAKLMPGVSDWREFEYPFTYIETDNLAYARKAFGILNGKGKQPQSQYQQLRNSVFVIRIDGDDSDNEDVAITKKVAMAENHHCFPVEVKSPLLKYPGTFSNISAFKNLSLEEIDISCGWHNKYFHYESVHVSLFFIFRDLCREFGSAKITLTPKLLEELAALIQSLFGNLSQYQTSVKEAHRRWHEKQYGYQGAWSDDAYACALVQLYQKFGGEERIAPTLLDRFNDLIDFFDEDILSLAA